MNPPEEKEDCYWTVGMDARDGWTVAFYYDCGELNHITYWVSPAGEEIDPWEMPESHDRDALINWRGIGCMARLLEAASKRAAHFLHAKRGDEVRVKHEPGFPELEAHLVLAVYDERPGPASVRPGPQRARMDRE